MSRTLYVYDHCPFCVKARMIFGLKDLPVTLTFLLNDDEDMPIRMVGSKMVPILEEDGAFMAESMDIVARIDAEAPVLTGPTRKDITDWISSISTPYTKLFLPRAASAPLPEFATTAARAYFIRKKEASAGAFSPLLDQSASLIADMNDALKTLDRLIESPSAVNGTLSTDDLHLFAALHSLSLVKGLTDPAKVEAYRQEMSHRAKVPLLDDLAA